MVEVEALILKIKYFNYAFDLKEFMIVVHENFYME